jgi:hypothetical protein
VSTLARTYIVCFGVFYTGLSLLLIVMRRSEHHQGERKEEQTKRDVPGHGPLGRNRGIVPGKAEEGYGSEHERYRWC